jgi:regulator of replication initiation timing
MDSFKRSGVQEQIRSAEKYIDTAHRRMAGSNDHSGFDSMESPTHIQAILEKYSTPTLSDDPESLLKKRKANYPLTIDNSVNFGNADSCEKHHLNASPPASIQTLITQLFDKSMNDIKDMISADKEDSKRLLESVMDKMTGIEHKINGMHSSLQSKSLTIDQLVDEHKQLRVRNEMTDGRLTRVEKVLNDLREELLQANARSMKDNLVFQRIPENVLQRSVIRLL